jgi:hypothetical protein
MGDPAQQQPSEAASSSNKKPGIVEYIKSVRIPCIPWLTCEVVSNAVFFLLVVFTFVFLWGDPLLKKNTHVTLVRQHIDVHRARDPLNLRIKGTDLSSKAFSHFNKINQDDAQYEVYSYIEKYFVPLDAKGAERASAQLTPLQATMLMMGCYGYPHAVKAEATQSQNIEHLLRQDWIDHATVKDFAMNFLLQALEDRREGSAFSVYDLHRAMSSNNISQLAGTPPGSGHDRSACSCLKDFASPSLFHLGSLKLANNNIVEVQSAAKDVTCERRQYMNDACSVQRVLDYALDGTPDTSITQPAVTLSEAIGHQMLLTTAPTEAFANTPRRHILDPLLAAFAATTGQASSQLDSFLTAYCRLAPARCLEVGLTAPYAGQQLLTMNPKLKMLLKYIKPHNKLRPPQMCANVNECTQAEREQGKVSQATYEAYTHKYNMAFHTCARDGVPQYVRSRLNTIDTAGVYSLAEAWLLLAAVFAWTWAYYVDSRTEESEAVDTRLSNGFLVVGAALSGTAYVMLLIKLGHFFDDLYDKSYQEEQKPSITDDASGLFTVLWLIFAALLAVIFGWLGILKFVKEENVRNVLSCGMGKKKEEKHDNVTGQLVYGKPVEQSGGQPMQSLAPMRNYMHVQPFNTGVTFMTPGARKEQNHQIQTHKQSMRLIETLQRVAPPAQVAQDLAVISGLTTLAIACVTQRGVSDVNVITTVAVWFFAIGLLAHLSNIMRLTHVYAQFHHAAAADKHMRVVPFTRTGLAVGLGVMLFVFLRLAGLDGSVGSLHAEQHQTLFAVLSLLMLCGADVIDGVLAPAPSSSVAEMRALHFWKHVSAKSYYMGWLVLLSLFVLHTHRSGAVCKELGATQKRDGFGAACYFAF